MTPPPLQPISRTGLAPLHLMGKLIGAICNLDCTDRFHVEKET